MSEEEVYFSDKQSVRTIILNRPASKNALTLPVVKQLVEFCQEAAENDSVRVIAISGVKGSFCSGLDLKQGAEGLEEYGGMRQVLDKLYHGAIRAIAYAPKPVVALVDGPAAGFGADLAFACDIRLASPRARFSERFGKLNLIPDGGGTYTLPQLIGVGRALEMIFTAESVPAERALSLGLINHLFSEEEFQSRCDAFLEKLSKGAPMAMAAAKRLVRESANKTLKDALSAEAETQEKLLQTGDFMRGLQAFVSKSEPEFEGN